jgi:hypothetical protein
MSALAIFLMMAASAPVAALDRPRRIPARVIFRTAIFQNLFLPLVFFMAQSGGGVK